MIKINLAKRKQSAAVQGGSASKGASLFGGFNFNFKKGIEGGTLPIRQILLGAGALAIGYVYLEDIKKKEMSDVEAQIAVVTKKLDTLTKEYQSLKGFEAKKKALDEDEKVLRAKIETIDKLSLDRQTPPKVLLIFPRVLPKAAWIESLTFDQTTVKFKGRAVDIGFISELTAKLKSEALLTDVTLTNTEQNADSAEGTIAKFEYSAKRRNQ